MEVYLSGISRIKGVNAFFIVDQNGNMICKNFTLKMQAGAEKKISKTIAACGNTYLSISPRRFGYAAFLRQNNTQVLIFPFGRHFLTVVADAGAQNPETDRIAHEIFSILLKGKHK